LDFCMSALGPLAIPLSEAIREFVDARRMLKDANEAASLVEASAFFIRESQKRHIPRKAFPELVAEFLDDLKKKERSYRHWGDCHARLGKAAKAFKGGILEITASDLETWLDSIKARGRNRNNYRGALTTLFSFARKRGYLPRSAPTEAEYVTLATDRGNPIRIYTPEQIKEILHFLPDRWVSFAAIGAFAGLRAAEVHRLDWKDVNLDEGHIVVDRHKDKTGRRRIVPILPNLKAWLLPHVRKEGWVCPHYSHDSTLLIEFSKAFKKTGIVSVHNGFRHSYASHRLAAVKSADQVALEMNTSSRKLFQNYRELVTEKTALAYFYVFPNAKRRKQTSSAQNLVAAGSAVGPKSRKKLSLSEQAMAA
jgi:integrase